MATKEEWENEYRTLENLLTDFQQAYSQSKNGRNKAIRKSAERDTGHFITLIRFRIERNPELSKLFVENGYGEPFAYDEFYQSRYFGGDMSDFLKKIQGKIDELFRST